MSSDVATSFFIYPLDCYRIEYPYNTGLHDFDDESMSWAASGVCRCRVREKLINNHKIKYDLNYRQHAENGGTKMIVIFQFVNKT